LLLAIMLVGHFGFGIELPWPYFLLPLSAVVVGVYTSTQQWVARAADYRWYAVAQCVNSIANIAAACLLWAVAGALSGSLIVAYVAGLTAAAIVLIRAVMRGRERVPSHGLPRPAALLETARRYKRFPAYVLPTWLMLTLGMSAQPFVLQLLFDLREVGQYSIASRFLLVPSALIGGAVNEAFRAEFVDRLRRGMAVTAVFKRTLTRLALFAVPVFLVIFALAPLLFGWAFGAEYRHSGVLSRYLCLGVLAQFISQPVSVVFVATGYVRRGFVAQLALTGLPMAGLVAGGYTGDMERALLVASVVTAVVAASTTAWAYACCQRAERANRRDANA
jgi:O-antigen/teichoic acid export membrane protein